jgi:hypothetical protein
MFFRRLLTLACAILVTCAAACLRIGEPTSDERRQLQQWSAAVSDQDRTAVEREAATHTEWMERKRTQWMITEYRARYMRQRTKDARRAAATQRAATLQAATRATSQP